MLYMVRYSEIFLKSEGVRRRWESRLVRNIKMVLDCKVRRDRGRIWVLTDDERADEKLKKVFGIVSFSKCVHCKLEELEKRVLEFCKEIGIDRYRTFAVRVKRVGTHDFTSQQKAAELGSVIVKNFGLKVDLENPEVTVYVEIRDEDCYIFKDIVEGPGGIPVGVEGRVVSLFSGGIDSPVATWMMMKRGCEVLPVYFDCRPFTDDTTLKRAESVAEILREYYPEFRLRVVEHGRFLERAREILKGMGFENYTCIVCKRRMLRVAEEIARELGAKGIVTGDSLGQVASQTLDNIMVIDEVCRIPVYRPLIGMDKVEIEGIARKIGTYEKSIAPVKECTAVPRRPVTRAKIEVVKMLEEKINTNPSF